MVDPGARRSRTSAQASGSSDTSAKASQLAMYCPALGFSCEMSFNATTMNTPALASSAPAPTIVGAGAPETFRI
jgi:hypothetical protein